MALNITFDGYAFDKNSTIGNSNINYQAFFYRNGTTSSDSKWNDVRTIEFTGYYSINLGDHDWLGQEGVSLSNSIVLIVFWKGGLDRTADCSVLTEWGVMELVLDGSSVYSNNTQTMDNIGPDLNWSNNVPGHPYVDTTYTVFNTSDDEHSWVFGTTTMYHWHNRYGQIINGPNYIESTDIYWGDGDESLGLSGASNSSHSWDAAGTYNIGIEVFDNCGASASGTETINIYWHEPVPNITMTPADPEPNELVYFEYSGTDIDDRIISIDWFIEDDGSYGTTNTDVTYGRDDTVPHSGGQGTDWYGQSGNVGAFTNPGEHNVSIVIHWNDGFTDQTINYDKDFTQNLFSGPTISFSQSPAQVTLGSGVVFTNTSTNTGRVGLGLPDHEEYEWTWYDGTVEESESDKQYSYNFEKTTSSIDCSIQLCANWNDGFGDYVTCVSGSVVFATTVTITPEDCYYRIEVIGTSSDGSISGYGWTVSSGTTETGPWTEIWQSPVDINQQSKTICFTSVGWYKIEGFVYGSGDTTSDYETWYIEETCPGTVGTSVYNIWNGTGVLDIGTDWVHSGVGTESEVAMYRGTNGLLLSNTQNNDIVYFNNNENVNINDYDFLSFWINIKNWPKGGEVTIKLHSNSNSTPTHNIKLSDYIIFEKMNEWQRVMIPLYKFQIPNDTSKVGWPTFINELTYAVRDSINFWIDDIALTAGKLVTLGICTPELETYQVPSGSGGAPQYIPCRELSPVPEPRDLILRPKKISIRPKIGN